MDLTPNWDVGLGLGFSGLGCVLLARGWTMPAGTGGVPGPGFFPLLVGAFVLIAGLVLTYQSMGSAPDYWSRGWWDRAIAQIVGVTAVCVLYLVFWQEVHFLIGTTVLLTVIYLILGQVWWRAGALAVSASFLLYGIFRWMFNIRF